ncbi:MAG: glycoside hydrolase family 127 protein [Bacteroidia bacterium]|nr:glycoside hydrolase family 127 protein [Bacteroidia bacterium]
MPDNKPGAEEYDHGVHFLESTTPWALGYLWTGNREFLEAAMGWNDLLQRDAMQPYGVFVADEFCGPAGAYRGTETCDVSAYMWSQTELLRIGGQGVMGDRVERAFFNAAPAVVSRDFTTHVYTQMPNRIVAGDNGRNYRKKQWPLCCTASLNRMLPNYLVNMWMATYDNGLAATTYGPCKVSALVSNHVPLELTCRTDYPFNDVIDITVNPLHTATFPLSFRIPGWCTNPGIMVNGAVVKMTPNTNGFVRIERQWKSNDRIRLQFPMSVRVTTGRDSNADGAPYASVGYGPLLFALPIPYTTNENTPDSTAKWNYALDTQGEFPGSDITVERKPMPVRWNWPAESPVKLHINVVSFNWDGKALPGKPVADNGLIGKKTGLIPYGCTQFRVSMFPVTERTFHLSGLAKPVQPIGK